MRLGMLWALFVASVKMFVRNRAAVFFILVIPPDYQAQVGGDTGLVAYASNADPAQAQVAQGLLQQAVGSAMFGSLGSDPGAPTFGPPVAFESVESRDLGYIDFLVPGIVGMTIMQLGLFGVAFGF